MRIGIIEYMIKAQINDKELVEHIESLPKDEMAVFVMADGRVRGALFHGTRRCYFPLFGCALCFDYGKHALEYYKEAQD